MELTGLRPHQIVDSRTLQGTKVINIFHFAPILPNPYCAGL